jgi:hypothetical protein
MELLQFDGEWGEMFGYRKFDCQLRFSLNECCENLEKTNVGDAIKLGESRAKAARNKKRNKRKGKNFKRGKAKF